MPYNALSLVLSKGFCSVFWRNVLGLLCPRQNLCPLPYPWMCLCQLRTGLVCKLQRSDYSGLSASGFVISNRKSRGSSCYHCFSSLKISGPRSLWFSWPFPHYLQYPVMKYAFQARRRSKWKSQKAQHLCRKTKVFPEILHPGFTHREPKFYHVTSPRCMRDLEKHRFFFSGRHIAALKKLCE